MTVVKHKTPAAPAVETIHTEVPPAVAAQLMQPPRKGKQTAGDPLWTTRRRRLDWSLGSTLLMMMLSIRMGPAMAAIVVPPAFIFAGMVIGAYMGVAEWGRINGVLAANSPEKE